MSKKKVLLRGVFINRDTNGEGVLKVGTTLIRVSTVMGILYSWPLRILNPSFAEWCVKTAKEMINYIKEAYQKNLSKVEYKVNDKR